MKSPKAVSVERATVMSINGLSSSVPEQVVTLKRTRQVLVTVHETCEVRVRAPNTGLAVGMAEMTLQANHEHMTWLETGPVTIGPNEGSVVDLSTGPTYTAK